MNWCPTCFNPKITIEEIYFRLNLTWAIFMFHANIKHIEVHYHFMKESIIFGEFNLEHVATKNELIDIFIKSLGKTKYMTCRENINVFSLKKLETLDMFIEQIFWCIVASGSSFCALDAIMKTMLWTLICVIVNIDMWNHKGWEGMLIYLTPFELGKLVSYELSLSM